MTYIFSRLLARSCLTPTVSSHLSCRPFTDEIGRMAKFVSKHVQKNFDPNHPDFNSVTVNGFWGNRRINPHRDNSYCPKTGKFMTNQNCQKKGTVTAIAAFGDTRELEFFLCRHKKPSDGKKRSPYIVVPKPWVLKLKHGTLFILHPEDEMLLQRFYHDDDRTFFKHGCRGVSSGRLSLGLVFRVSVHSRAVFSNTGRVVLTAEERKRGKRKPTFSAGDKVMKKYMLSKTKTERDEQTTALWRAIERKYFKR